MRICSSSVTKILGIFLLGLSSICDGKKSFDTNDFTSLLGDFRSLESEEQKSILKSLSMPEDILVGEESKKSILIRIDPKRSRNAALYQTRPVNETDKNFDLVQWYATPSRTVEHHVERGKLESSIDSQSKIINDNRDLKAQGTSPYGEDYNHEHHDQDSRENHGHDSHERHQDDHYHADHPNPDHSGADENDNHYAPYHSQDNDNNYDGPSSDVFYKKMKLKKVRKNCTRTKSKKVEGWPDRSDTIVHGRSNTGPHVSHYDSQTYHHQSVPALPESSYSDIPKLPNFPESPGGSVGFSGEHLHGIPRTHFFQYKDGEGVSHFHLHNHHHHYLANGKKISLANGPNYRNLADQFGKLKTMLDSKDSGTPYALPHLTDNYRSTLNVAHHDSIPKLGKDGSEKLGYHYTGTHESYGKKTYKRIYPRNNSPSTSFINDDKAIGMEMFRYGAGQYGTDEFSSNDDKGRYPNEVSSGVENTYPNSGEIYDQGNNKPYHDTHSSLEYNSNTPRESPYTSYSGEYDSNYKQIKEDIFNQKVEDKAPYTPQTPIRGTVSGELNSGYGPPSSDIQRYPNSYPSPYNSNGGKNGLTGPSNNIPPSDIQRHPKSYPSSYNSNGGKNGLTGPSNKIPPSDFQRHPEPYPTPYNSGEVKNGPSSNISPGPPSIGNPSPPNVDVTHSISYSQDGDIESLNFGPENHHLFQNLRPEPDPLTIPKNARVFEHHIRLHPMHYNIYAGAARSPVPVNYPAAPFGNNAYPVPLHKLMPNPLKIPIVPAPSLYPNPHLNQMLQAYQSRSLYGHRWW